MARVNKFASVNLNDLFGKKEPAVKTAGNTSGSGARAKGASHGMLVLTRPVKQPIKIGSGITGNLKKETSESLKPTTTDTSGWSNTSQIESANVGLVKDNPKPDYTTDKLDVYVPPSLRGLHSTSLSVASVKPEPVPVEKTAVLSGEEFPSLQASNTNGQQQQTKDNQLDSKEQLEKLHHLSLQAQSKSCLNDVTEPDLNRFQPQRPQFFRPSRLRGNEHTPLEKPETVTEKPDGYLSRNPHLLGDDERANSFGNRLGSANGIKAAGSVIEREEQAEMEVLCGNKGGRYEREDFPRPGSGESRYYERETFPQPGSAESRYYEREAFTWPSSGGSRYYEREEFTRPGSGGSRYEREALPRPWSGGSRYEREALPLPGSGGSRFNQEALPRPVSGGNRYEREVFPRPGSGGSRYDREGWPQPGSDGSRLHQEALPRPGLGGSRYAREGLPRPGSGGSRYEREGLPRPGSGGSMYEREGLPQSGLDGSRFNQEASPQPISGGSRSEREALPHPGSGCSRFNQELLPRPVSGGSTYEKETLGHPSSVGGMHEREVISRAASGGGNHARPGSGGSGYGRKELILPESGNHARPGSGGSGYGRKELILPESVDVYCTQPGFNGGGDYVRPNPRGRSYESEVVLRPGSGDNKYSRPSRPGMGSNGWINGRENYRGSSFNGRQNYQRWETNSITDYADGQNGKINNAYESNREHGPFRRGGPSREFPNRDDYRGRGQGQTIVDSYGWDAAHDSLNTRQNPRHGTSERMSLEQLREEQGRFGAVGGAPRDDNGGRYRVSSSRVS
ncbi:uncharacterized protein LOC131030863 [Cryptomeria japonica]|uniref:uncharacterized protein LOC131030863 n=1 Tax=Cryptomeria japonica TaxID=3369 RepID=UPI0027DA73BC|nr:uncharacterized protein LOC131030863 [Cryptomeria japonica]XP_057817780.2 uncharacterized protein LOC131030863 [Cryptomeria japonica]XP_057817781.2 uncharacterized protein LOC131030863 [Cryptomeria japonica]